MTKIKKLTKDEQVQLIVLLARDVVTRNKKDIRFVDKGNKK